MQIMEEDLKVHMDYYGKSPEDVVFQQNDYPKHTCKKAKIWLKDNGFEVMDWPAQSPDFFCDIDYPWQFLTSYLGLDLSVSLLCFFGVFPHECSHFWPLFCDIDPLGSVLGPVFLLLFLVSLYLLCF